jgi:hypothetical protein
MACRNETVHENWGTTEKNALEFKLMDLDQAVRFELRFLVDRVQRIITAALQGISGQFLTN